MSLRRPAVIYAPLMSFSEHLGLTQAFLQGLTSGNIFQHQTALRKASGTEALNHCLKDLPDMKPKNLSQRPLESMQHHEAVLMQKLCLEAPALNFDVQLLDF